jgi:hypothetical protein
MAESIDYYMDQDERSAICDALRLAIDFVKLEWQKSNLVYDKDRMAEWEVQESRFQKTLEAFD